MNTQHGLTISRQSYAQPGDSGWIFTEHHGLVCPRCDGNIHYSAGPDNRKGYPFCPHCGLPMGKYFYQCDHCPAADKCTVKIGGFRTAGCAMQRQMYQVFNDPMDHKPDIEIIDGDIFDSLATMICHQVNTLGVMGAGLAKQVASRYPDVLREYKRYCKTPAVWNQAELLGDVLFVYTEEAIGYRWVANIFAQSSIDRNQVNTNYTALQRGLRFVAWVAETYGIKRIALPYGIGCGLAGGNWDRVYRIIYETFAPTDIKVELWRKGEPA